MIKNQKLIGISLMSPAIVLVLLIIFRHDYELIKHVINSIIVTMVFLFVGFLFVSGFIIFRDGKL